LYKITKIGNQKYHRFTEEVERIPLLDWTSEQLPKLCLRTLALKIIFEARLKDEEIKLIKYNGLP